jgi:hypothetical protein
MNDPENTEQIYDLKDAIDSLNLISIHVNLPEQMQTFPRN